MELLGLFLFYVGLIATVFAILKLVLNYSSKIGIKGSRKLYKDESHEKQDKNEALVDGWIKSNISSIIYRAVIMLIGIVILLFYAPEALPW